MERPSPLFEAHNPRPLALLCVDVLAAHFASRPTLRGIPTRFVPRVTALLPLDLPLDVAGPLIDDELYWQRRSLGRWGICAVEEHGCSWKRLFFEAHLQDFLEAAGPAAQSSDELLKLLALSKDYILSLRVRQLPSHAELGGLLQGAPLLSDLSLTYGAMDVGMHYEKELFGMRHADVASLAKALRVTETLTVMALPANQLDDEAVRTLASGLLGNSTVTSLDLSHNRIADRGAKALAKLLGPNSVLCALDLADNHLHADGGKYFGRALRANSSLQSLNLRLNRLGDEGAALLLHGCAANASLARLNLSCNAAQAAAAQALAALLPSNASLTELDLSGNRLDEPSARLVCTALGPNRCLRRLDLRGNGAEPDTLAAIEQLGSRNTHDHVAQLRRAQEEARAPAPPPSSAAAAS